MARFWFRTAMMFALMAGLCAFASNASAQGRGGRGGQGGPGGFGGGGPGGGGTLGLLTNDDVRKELDLVDEQVTKLTAIGDKLREDMRAQFEGLRDLSQEERQTAFAEMRTKMEERTKAMEAEVDEVLLPQQRERLAQINFQSQLRRAGGNSTGLTSPAVVAALEMTPEQVEKVTSEEEKVAKELADKVAKARNEARDQLLALLTPEQREKFKKLMGAEFRFTQQQGRGGPGGAGGGAGGRRGGAQPQGN